MSSTAPSSDQLEPDNEDETVRVTVSVTDAKAAQELLSCLGNTSDAVSFSVDCVAMTGADPCVITVDHLSKKQIEVVKLAIDAGYYERPRQVSLSDLADTLGVSSSAVSQRLNSIEQKLVLSLSQYCK